MKKVAISTALGRAWSRENKCQVQVGRATLPCHPAGAIWEGAGTAVRSAWPSCLHILLGNKRYQGALAFHLSYHREEMAIFQQTPVFGN